MHEYMLQQNSAKMINALGKKPEDAVEAINIEKRSRVPAAVAVEDLETYQKDREAAIKARMLRDDGWIRALVDTHPLAAQVANNDYDKLSDAFGNVRKYEEGKMRPGERLFWESGAKATTELGANLVGAGAQLTHSLYLYNLERRLSHHAEADFPMSNAERDSITNQVVGGVTQLAEMGLMAPVVALFGGGALGTAGAMALLFGLTGGESQAKSAELAGASEEEIGQAFAGGFGINTLFGLVSAG